MIAFHTLQGTLNKVPALTIGLSVALACSHAGSALQWMQASDAAFNQQSHSTEKQPDKVRDDRKFLDLKELPHYVFGCYVIPYMAGKDIHNLLLTAKSIHLTLWKELPFVFKGDEGDRQLEQCFLFPQSLVPLAAIALKQYMLKNYPLAVEENKVVLPSLTPFASHKKATMIDLMIIKRDLFIQFLRDLENYTTYEDGTAFHSTASECYHTPPPSLKIYAKAVLLTAIYDYLSLPTIIKTLQIPDGDQARDSVQQAICSRFTILAALQNAHANDKQRQSAQRLLQDILAAGGASWLSAFSFVQVTSLYGNLFLHYEAKHGDTEVSRRLIRCGVDINEVDCDGSTPLHLAARYGHLDTVRLLLANHAHIDCKDYQQRTPLSQAAGYGHTDIVHALLAQGAHVNSLDDYRRTPLHRAVEYGNTDIVRTLLTQGAHVNSLNERRQTPLHYASRHEHPEFVQLLLKQGAKIDPPDNLGRTPLHYASQYDHPAVACWLLNQGAKIDAPDNQGQTPLYYASEYDCPAVARLLLKEGADIHKKDPSGKSMLHTAAYYNAINITKLLIEHGADTNLRDDYGSTPLHQITDKGRPTSMIRLLLDNNANINAQDNYGYSPLMTAISRLFSLKIAKLFIDHGADASVSHPARGTPLQWARKSLAEAQMSIGHDIMGDPPYDSKQAKHLLSLAKKDGIKPSFRSLSNHEQCDKAFRSERSMPQHPTISTPLAISPQNVCLVLSRQPSPDIEQMFGSKILPEMKWIDFCLKAIVLLEKAEAAQK